MMMMMMAFHVGCPITSRRICHCPLGFPRCLPTDSSKDDFLLQVSTLDDFLLDPWGIRVRDSSTATVRVPVPKVLLHHPPPPQPVSILDACTLPPYAAAVTTADGADVDALAAVSAQAKRSALQKKAAAAMVAAEDYARRFESGDLPHTAGDLVEEQGQGQSGSKVLCRMCLHGENEGSERAKKMLSCKSCGKKYHRSCLKNWSQNRGIP